jgi:hypothetical protein
MGDEMMKAAEPQKEHEWLQKLVGEWTYETEGTIGPDQPPIKSQGSESVRSLGGLWTLAEGQGQMPDGSPATTMMTLGYDPQKKRFVGTWIGSMMAKLWVYDGELDADGRKLSLYSEGPSMSGDGMAKYRDAIEVVSADHRIMTSELQGEDGNWTRFMTAHYRRKSA